MKGKVYLLALAACLGTAAAIEISAKAAGGGFFLLLVLCFLKKEKHSVCLFIVCIFLISLFRGMAADSNNVTSLSPETSFVDGKIMAGPDIDGNLLTMTLSLPHKETLPVSYIISSPEEKEELQTLTPGLHCRLHGSLSPPSKPSNFGAFDYQQYLYRQSAHWVFTPDHFTASHCLSEVTDMKDRLKVWRHEGIHWIENVFPEDVQGLIAALIFGERTLLEPDLLSSYQRLGLVHLLAVSGLHVGIITGTLFYIFIRLGITREHTYSLLIAFLPAYIILAGGAPSVIRASMMTLLVLICLKSKLPISPIDTIAWVFIFLLWHNPYYLFHIGFQLSFLVSFSLLVSSHKIFSKVKGAAFQLCFVSLIAQLSSFPLLVLHFYSVSFLSYPLNLFFIPFISLFVLPGSFILFFLSLWFPPAYNLFIIPFTSIVTLSHEVLNLAASIPEAQAVFGKPSLVIMGLFIITTYVLFLSFEKKKRAIVAASSLWVMAAGIQLAVPYLDKNGYVTLLDVGQGDSILIELPLREGVYLIDAGGHVAFEREEWQERSSVYDPGARVVVPYLQHRGIKQIDKMIVSHGHWDHYGGMFAVMEETKVKRVLYGNVPLEGEGERELFTAMSERKIPVYAVSEGDRWSTSGVDFLILSPKGNESSVNNRSIVLWMKMNGENWLFTGDMEGESEKRFIEEHGDVRADILKVAHHGSQTSTSPEFIKQIQPKAALIPAGRCNRFGHPHSSVLETLEQEDVMVFRTDVHGSVRFTFTEMGVKGWEVMLSEEGEVNCS